MNKKERELLTELFWVIQENKNEHHILYYSKDVLQSILHGELKIAENLLLPKSTPTILVPPKSIELGLKQEINPKQLMVFVNE
jgi:hypothetical protein